MAVAANRTPSSVQPRRDAFPPSFLSQKRYHSEARPAVTHGSLASPRQIGRVHVQEQKVARLTYSSQLSSDKWMNTHEIERFIPHRKPMLLVDEIVSRTENEIVCRKTFHEDEFFVQGHFPDQPIVPGVIQCECCLQAGAILLSADTMQASQNAPDSDDSPPHDKGSVPVATRMDSVKFKRMVRPGDTVEIQVVLNDRVSNAYFLTGKMLLNGKLAARLDFACSIANPGPPTSEKST